MNLSVVLEWLGSGGIVRALRHRDFTIFQCGIWTVNSGVWVQRIAVGWLTWTLTGSGAWLGIVALAQAIPAMVLMPFAGALGDRVDRVALMRVTQVFSVVLAGALAVLVWLDLITIWILLAYVVLFGLNNTIALPARMSIAPSLVPKADLPAAIAVNSVGYSIATFIGPAAAGVIIDQGGIAAAFVVNAVLYIPMLAALRIITPHTAEHRARAGGGNLLTDVVEGLRYVGAHVGIGPVLLLLFLSSMLARPVNDLLPGFADEVFGRGAGGLAMLASVFGIGGVAASLWLANRNRMEGTTRIFMGGLLVAAVFLFVFAVGRDFHVALICMIALGLANGMYMNAGQILIQTAVAGDMRARVMSLYTLTYRVGPSIGALTMGSLASLYGFPAPVAGGAVLLLLFWIAVLPRFRRVATGLEGATGQGEPAAPTAAIRPSPQ